MSGVRTRTLVSETTHVGRPRPLRQRVFHARRQAVLLFITVLAVLLQRVDNFFTCREAARSSRTVGRKEKKRRDLWIFGHWNFCLWCLLVCFYLILNFYEKYHNFFLFSIEFFNMKFCFLIFWKFFDFFFSKFLKNFWSFCFKRLFYWLKLAAGSL